MTRRMNKLSISETTGARVTRNDLHITHQQAPLLIILSSQQWRNIYVHSVLLRCRRSFLPIPRGAAGRAAFGRGGYRARTTLNKFYCYGLLIKIRSLPTKYLFATCIYTSMFFLEHFESINSKILLVGHIQNFD